MKILRNLFAIIGIICAEINYANALEPSTQAFKKQGIKVVYNADGDLNLFNGQSHTLVLVVYQLLSSNAFSSLRDSSDGIVKLLEGGNFDMSVLSKRKIIVHPLDRDYFYVDRFPETNYIGIVAGYNLLDSQNSTYITPLNERNKNRFFWRTRDKEVADTVVKIELGKEFIKKVEH